MINRPSLALVALIVAAFLGPLLGGMMMLETQAVAPGFASFILAAIGSSSDLPGLTHAFIGSFVVLALLALLLRRKVIQIPNFRFSTTALIFLGVLIASVMNSHLKAQSLQALGEWLLFGLAMYTTVAAVGRKDGPLAVLTAVFIGATLLARNGIVEYRLNAPTDPAWRIFGGWQQPNALAGMLLIGLLLGVGLAVTQKRLWATISALCSAVIAYALLHTQSKGGVVALACGLVLLTFLLLAVRLKPSALPWIGRLAVTGIVLMNIGAYVGFKTPAATENAVMTATSQGAPSVLGRFSASKETSEQSMGFRKLIYISCVELLREDAVGYGVGTFASVSAKPGLITQTHLAHNTLLQLAVEASPVAPILLLLVLAFWMELVLADSAHLPWKTNALRMSVVAAIVATMIHGITESNLYTFGIGLTFFILLGVGLQLSADAVSPEFTPKNGRIGGAAVAILIAGQLWQTGVSNYLHAEFRQQILSGNRTDALATLDQLKTLDGNDGETWFDAANVATSGPEQLECLKRASELQPLPRTLRAYANALDASGQVVPAISTIDEVLRMDPNNALAMLAKMKLEEKNGNEEQAVVTAKKLVAVEDTTYYRIRALPDMIPTETFDARLFLSARERDPRARAALLNAAVVGFERYLTHTWPSVKGASAEDPNASFGGETLAKATEKLKRGEQTARELAALYRTLGNEAEAAGADAAASDFAKALTPSEAK